MQTLTDKVVWVTDAEGDWLKIRVKNPRAICAELIEGKTYTVELKAYRKKRSKDANAYAWELIGKLADYYGVYPLDIYRQAIRSTSAYEIIPVREHVAERFPYIWGQGGLGFVVDDMGKSKIAGYHNFRCFYGSHVYDTQQMSRLIEVLKDDCRSCNIETLPPYKLQSLLEEWDHAQGNKG